MERVQCSQKEMGRNGVAVKGTLYTTLFFEFISNFILMLRRKQNKCDLLSMSYAHAHEDHHSRVK